MHRVKLQPQFHTTYLYDCIMSSLVNTFIPFPVIENRKDWQLCVLVPRPPLSWSRGLYFTKIYFRVEEKHKGLMYSRPSFTCLH